MLERQEWWGQSVQQKPSQVTFQRRTITLPETRLGNTHLIFFWQQSWPHSVHVPQNMKISEIEDGKLICSLKKKLKWQYPWAGTKKLSTSEKKLPVLHQFIRDAVFIELYHQDPILQRFQFIKDRKPMWCGFLLLKKIRSESTMVQKDETTS